MALLIALSLLRLPCTVFTSPPSGVEMASEEKNHTQGFKGSEPSFKDEEFTTSDQPHRLRRQLKNRHVAMISIGGVIGTGLFVGTATSLSNGGPVGLWLGYIVMGTIVLAVMVSLGEMVAYLPIAGGHIRLAERFVNPALSFAMGWNYWYNWTIIAELSAAALLIDYWHPNVNNAVWVIITIVVVVTINMLGAGAYGEAEFCFAMIKVLTISGLIILGVIIDLGGGPNHDRLGFRYWKNPGPFAQFDGIAGSKGRFLGWWSVLNNAAFSFIGTEIVAIAAGETKNPRRNLPRAIRRVYIRILLFYILGTFIIGLLVPYTNPQLLLASGTAASPFVIAIETAGIKALPSIINACLLTSAWSAASSDLYTSSRALYGLAAVGSAPRIFLRTSKSGLPYVSVTFCASFTLLAFMAASASAGKVFEWFSAMTSVAGLMTWFGICITYIRFHKGMKVQGIDRTTLPYYTRFQPFAAWYGAVWTFVICLFNGWSVFLKGQWNTATFVTSYLPLILFPILYIGARLVYRTSPVKPEDMDFQSDIAQIEADEVPEEPPKNKVEAFWAWLM
ncbi:amino acid permease [Chiua virens]|nr:amino acid permease [Chiua virens]